MKIKWKKREPRQGKPFNRCGEMTEAWNQLQSWYQTRLGVMLAEQEQNLLGETLSNLFGYQLLQVGRLTDEDWLTSSRVSQCNVMDFPPVEPLSKTASFQGLPEYLPIQTASMDVIVLPHVLEFSLQPHAVLREIERVLIPEGHVAMLIFNPVSLWSFWRMGLGWRRKVPWCGRYLSTTRVKDWLALLGFDVVTIQNYFYRPPLQQSVIMQRLQLLDRVGGRVWPIFGASKLVVAKKRLVTLTPIGPRWSTPKARIAAQPGLVEPFQRKHNKIQTHDS